MADLDDNTKWFEADASNTQAPPNGWPAGMLPNQVEPAAQAMMGAVKRFWNRINGVYTSAGAAGTFAVSPAASYPTGYVDGERFTFKAHQASRGGGAGGDTLNWNGLGAKKIFKPSTTGMAQIDANDIVNGQRVDTTYDSTLDSSAGGFAMMGPPTASISAPVGSVLAFAGSSAPGGWLICNGQAVSRSTYAALFALIGGNYGAGDGSTTFNVPDLRGRVPAGFDSGNATGRLNGAAGVNAGVLANAGGAQLVTLDQSHMPVHTHGYIDGLHAHGVPGNYLMGTGGGTLAGTSPGSGQAYDIGNVTSVSGVNIAIQNAGGSQPHGIVQPTIILNFIIKT